MESVGFIGLGKLGLPCAAALSSKANVKVHGYDVNPKIKEYVSSCTVPYKEELVEEYLKTANIVVENSVLKVVENSNMIFVAVQTPHEKEYEGISPTPTSRKDFDYSFLIGAVTQIKEAFVELNKTHIDLVIISTVLPGTIKKLISPIVDGLDINVIYNPYFIAMGTTIPDFLNPEFVVMGTSSWGKASSLQALYAKFIRAYMAEVRYEEAELIKVSYNTFIGLKIVFANTLAEITQSMGGNVDNVLNVLSKANTRIISTKYLSAGMGDGGGCHPRDQIAMSWLAKTLGLSYDLFETLALARDSHTKRHAEIIKQRHEELELPVIILGKAYKKDVNLTVGSPSLLLQHYLDELGVQYTVVDPVVDDLQVIEFVSPAIFYVATPHTIFKHLSLPMESRVLDPWGNSIEQQYAIHSEHLGRYRFG